VNRLQEWPVRPEAVDRHVQALARSMNGGSPSHQSLATGGGTMREAREAVGATRAVLSSNSGSPGRPVTSSPWVPTHRRAAAPAMPAFSEHQEDAAGKGGAEFDRGQIGFDRGQIDRGQTGQHGGIVPHRPVSARTPRTEGGEVVRNHRPVSAAPRRSTAL
ncbi:hypothetical protein T484DRAFT_1963776, partial [Baffinella frigidus]